MNKKENIISKDKKDMLDKFSKYLDLCNRTREEIMDIWGAYGEYSDMVDPEDMNDPLCGIEVLEEIYQPENAKLTLGYLKDARDQLDELKRATEKYEEELKKAKDYFEFAILPYCGIRDYE